MRVFYPAIVDHEDGVYGITFPDFPGCVSSGESLQEACNAGEEALQGHIDLMQADGDAIPLPSDINAAPKDLEVNEVMRTMIGARATGRKKRINVTLDEFLLSDIKTKVGERGTSAFLEKAARHELAKGAAE
jgi:predicted RNase H-like HicB family nuclease